MRQQYPQIQQDTLHMWLNAARLHTTSLFQNRLTSELWSQTIRREAERLQRLPVVAPTQQTQQ